MKSYRCLGICVAAALITMAAASSAHAQRRMLVLIDASGSMLAPRNNADNRGANRFEAAKTLASDRVQQQSDVDAGVLVAVYTFRGTTTLVPHTGAAFVDYIQAQDAIEALSTAANVGGSTPLAGALCDAIDKLAETDATIQILQVSSDGEENSTPTTNPCWGSVFTGTVTDPSQYPTSSYQAKVLNYITNTSSAIVKVDLFESSQITFAPSPDPEGVLSPQVRSLLASAPTANALNPLEQFFTFVAQSTGGELTIARDEEVLPVSGDLNNDRCVDRTDAILVARAFGRSAPQIDGRFDLNADRTVDFSDYMLQRARITPACGPDPFATRAPIVCSGPGQVVIDGQAVENGGVSIDVRSACQIIIRNSLIVAGQNAIKINGSAVVRVDNSIIVGQNAVLGTTGTIILSAANTIFHGALSTNGAFSYINRGGNVFE